MKKKYLLIAVLFVILPLYLQAQDIFRQEGIASWYGREFEGRPTASGEIFDSSRLTAAHPSLPFGTMVVVTNQHNNKSVIVRINDRGPFVSSRIIDVSRAAAEQLDMIVTGTAPVSILSIDRIPVSNPAAVSPVTASSVNTTAAAVVTAAPAAAAEVNIRSDAAPVTGAQAASSAQVSEAETAFAAIAMQTPSLAQFRLTPDIVIEPARNYRLQVGSYKNAKNAIDAFARLTNIGLNPAYERFVNSNNEEFFRVVISGIKGSEIQNTINKLSQAGFSEALIRAEN